MENHIEVSSKIPLENNNINHLQSLLEGWLALLSAYLLVLLTAVKLVTSLVEDLGVDLGIDLVIELGLALAARHSREKQGLGLCD